jgi:hypothetical protein
MIPKLITVRAAGVGGLAPIDITIPSSTGSIEPLVVTGPTASGKTRLLEAVIAAKEACGGYGVHPVASDWFADPSHGTIELTWRSGETADPRAPLVSRWEPAAPKASHQTDGALKLALREFSPSPTQWKLEYMHATRQLDVSRSEQPQLGDRPQGYARIAQANDKYAFVRRYLKSNGVSASLTTESVLAERGLVLSADRAPPHAGFARTLANLTDKLQWIGVRMDGARPGCIFARRARNGHVTLELRELSHAERMLVLYAATIDALGLARSLVLIDCPELHLHPEDQIRLMEGLRAVLAEGQLIVATTSPAILRSVASGQVVVLG